MMVKYGFAALAAAVTLATSTTDALAVDLRLGTSFPPTHLMQTRMLNPWAEEVAKASNGSLAIKMHPGGELVSGPNSFKRTQDGVVDISESLQGYTSDQFPRTLLIELPGLAKDNRTATQMMWRAVELLKPEYDKTKILALWSTGPNAIVMRKDPVRTVEDLKGKRVRTPSALLGDVAKALGMSPVSMQIGDVYQAMQTGVLDAILTGHSALEGFKLGEVSKYYPDYTFGVSPLFLVMNQRSYDRLSAEHRAIIDRTSGEKLSQLGAGVYDAEAVRQLENEVKAGRGEVNKLSDAERKKIEAAVAPVAEKMVADREAADVPAKRILATMKGGAS
jgi:TRAP-type transport system periplasmic protein